MKILAKTFLVLFIFLITNGCAKAKDLAQFRDPAAPRNASEAFPTRADDPTVGIITNEGTASLQVFIYNRRGKLIQEAYLPGANRFFTVNGRHLPQVWIRKLPIGWYKLEVFPFYYQIDLVPPRRYRVDLPKQIYHLTVTKNPHREYFHGRHFGWVLRLYGGDVPSTAHGLPGVQLDLQGNFRQDY